MKVKGVYMKIQEFKAREHELLLPQLYFNPEELIIFDIETTGFVADKTTLYLIGCAYYKEDAWYIKQWFNDDGKSEEMILSDFMSFIATYKYIMHYNGDGFDIPYINKKLAIYDINYSFDALTSIDMYKILKPYKDILRLDNLKQKSIEQYLGVNRIDKYSGGDLIKVYQEFLTSNDTNRMKLLLQHNYEDIEGLLYTTSLIAICRLKEGAFTIDKLSIKNDKLIFSLKLEYCIPKRITLGQAGITVSVYKNDATISVMVVNDTLKFFFDDYKEYYYLPAEDRAIHKSVAAYVDKEYRIQATKENCYVKQEGHFITQLNTNTMIGFKYDNKDKTSYIELSDSFLKDKESLLSYCKKIISILI